MKTMYFKTNINCSSCLRSVTPALEANERIMQWSVDLENEDRILRVEAKDSVSPTEVRQAVATAGFTAQEVDLA